MIKFILICIYLVGLAGHAQFYQKHMPEDIPYWKVLVVSAIFPISMAMEILQLLLGLLGIQLDYNLYIIRVTDDIDDKSE
jgi:uncharacterized protein (DUF983 family)